MREVKAHTDTVVVVGGGYSLQKGDKYPFLPKQTMLMLATPLHPGKGHLVPHPWLLSLGCAQ